MADDSEIPKQLRVHAYVRHVYNHHDELQGSW